MDSIPANQGDPSPYYEPSYSAKPPVQSGPSYNWRDIWNEYKPETRATNRYNTLLDETPDIADYNPSFMRRLVASGMGMSQQDPLKTMESVMYAPYMRDMAQWKEKTTPFQQAAQNEVTSNVNERNARTQMSTASINQQKADDLNTKNQQNYEIQMQKNAILDYKAKGATFTSTGSRIIAKFPDGSTMDAGPSYNWDPRDIAALNAQNRLDVANVQGTTARDVAEIRGDTARDVQTDRGNAARDTARIREGTSTGGTGTGGGTTGTGPKINRLEARRMINDELKERYQTDTMNKRWIDNSLGGGNYDFKPRPVAGEKDPSTTTFGIGGRVYTQTDVDNYDDFRQDVDPSYTPPVSNRRGAGPGPGPATQQPGPPTAKPSSTQGVGPSTIPSIPSVGHTTNIPNAPMQTHEPAPPPGQGSQFMQQVERARAEKFATRPAELRRLLADPNTPNVMKSGIQRELNDLLAEKATAMLTAKGMAPSPANIKWLISTGGVN